jgi:hypothetical protein
MKWTAIAGALLLATGCNVSSGVQHTLVLDQDETVPAGVCMAVEGPFHLPGGATSDFTVTDVDGTDDMDVSVIADADGCNFVLGDGTVHDVASVSGGTGSLPGDAYDFVVRCNNAAQDCLFTLTWTADY